MVSDEAYPQPVRRLLQGFDVPKFKNASSGLLKAFQACTGSGSLEQTVRNLADIGALTIRIRALGYIIL